MLVRMDHMTLCCPHQEFPMCLLVGIDIQQSVATQPVAVVAAQYVLQHSNPMGVEDTIIEVRARMCRAMLGCFGPAVHPI